jgi:hypothetical protein
MTNLSAEDLRSQFSHVATLATILDIPFDTLVDALAEAEVRLQRDRKHVPAACARTMNGHGKKAKK